ncbi:MAG: RusA family crossover junction endodeoxyribonuclease [Victivallales bacterium]|nr:RusA family crossover junction endodeoxyribonuclease [Victivallales bacterium]
MIILELPYPPSINHYWRMGNHHMYLSDEGKRYKQIVFGIVRIARVAPFIGDVSLIMDAYPPDRRRRDLDNIQKAVWDALTDAGLYEDDSQVKHMEAWMREPLEHGKIIVTVSGIHDRFNPPANSLVPC